MNYIYNSYQSISNYSESRMDSLVRAKEGTMTKRLLFGACLYPLLCLTDQYMKHAINFNASPITSCPPEIAEMNIIQKIGGPLSLSILFASVGITEELIFRELIQNYCLKEKGSSLLGRISSNAAAYWNGTSGKLARIVLTTLLFSSLHAPQYFFNGSINTEGLRHAISVIPLSLWCASLQESDEFGSLSAMGLHGINNLVTTLFICYKTFSLC